MSELVQNCPDENTLENYLLGRLPKPENESCELHLAACPPCVETIRTLKVDDTLDGLTRSAWPVNASTETDEENSQSDSGIVENLIERMRGLGKPSHLGIVKSGVLEDRAAEIQRLLDPATHEDSIGRLGHYRIQKLIGAGSTGVVYKALDESLDRTVAIKVLRPSLGEAARHRFIAEARATAALNHPNVVTIFNVGTEGPLAFIAMQWLPGETLEEKLERQKALSVDEAKKLIRQIAAGLSAAHENKLIHRDIKPANIWIESDQPNSRILDFGLVRINDEDPQLTCTGMIAGTPCFMSPEQSRGAELDHRSDLFSLGCVFYQSLTGRLPFVSGNALATLQAIQRDQPAPPNELDPAIPQDLSDLAMCLLEKSPNRRPPNAKDLICALDLPRKQWGFDVEHYESTPPKPQLQTSTSNGLGGMWKIAAGLVASLLLITGGFIWGPQIVRVVTNHGEIIVESDDDNIQIEVLENGERIAIIDSETDYRVDVVAGNYQIRPVNEDNSVVIDRDNLKLSRGGKEIVSVTRIAIASPITDSTVSQPTHRLKNEQPGVLAEEVVDEPFDEISLERSDSDLNEIVRQFKAVPPQQLQGKEPYTLDSGDVLAIFVEGVIGNFDEAPPINYPDPASGLLPCTGFPIPIRGDGTLSLPLVAPIQLKSKTIEESEALIKQAFTEGDAPILKESSRILVSLMRRRDYQPLPSSGASQNTAIILQPTPDHKLSPGDVLGIFVEGVLGKFNGEPPIHFPAPSSGLSPTIGFPIPVRSDGTISLPLIPKLAVEGKTIEEVEEGLVKAYKGSNKELEETDPEWTPILRPEARILVNIMRISQTGQPDSKTKERKNADNSDTRDLGTSAQSNVDSFDKAPTSQSTFADTSPVFKGQSFESWVTTYETEKELSIQLDCVEGLMRLVADSSDQEKRSTAIRIATEVICNGPGFAIGSTAERFNAARNAVFFSLRPNEAGDFLIELLTDGTDATRMNLSSFFADSRGPSLIQPNLTRLIKKAVQLEREGSIRPNDLESLVHSAVRFLNFTVEETAKMVPEIEYVLEHRTNSFAKIRLSQQLLKTDLPEKTRNDVVANIFRVADFNDWRTISEILNDEPASTIAANLKPILAYMKMIASQTGSKKAIMEFIEILRVCNKAQLSPNRNAIFEVNLEVRKWHPGLLKYFEENLSNRAK